MSRKRKVKESGSSIPKAIGLSLIISAIITVLGTVAGAYLIQKEMIQQQNIGIVVTAVLTLSSAAGTFAAMSTAKRMILQTSILSGVSYFLLLLSMTALFFGGQYDGIMADALAIMAGCSVAALLNILPNKRGKSFKRKTPYR